MSSLNLSDFKLEKGNYHIIFEYTPGYYVDNVRHIDYWGTGLSFQDFDEVEVGSSEYKKILEYLKEHYEYAPFDYGKVAESLKYYNHIDC